MSVPSPDEVLDSLGQHLAGLGLVRYSTTVGYGADDPAVPAYVLYDLPESPDTAVAAAVAQYATDRDRDNPDVLVRLRFRAAGDSPLPVALLANAVRGVLRWPQHRTEPETWPGGVRVLDVLSQPLVRPVQDANGRWMRADTYRFTLNPGA